MTVLRFPYQAEQVETYKVTQRKKVSHVIQRELMGKNPRWMRRQEEAYLNGMNLLCLSDQDFSPQVSFLNLSRALYKLDSHLKVLKSFLCNIIEKGIFLIDKLSTLPPFMLK